MDRHSQQVTSSEPAENGDFMLKPETIKSLQNIILIEYGRNLSMREVTEIGNVMVNYYDLLARILHEEKLEDNKEKTNGN